jgi:3',5'-cyclic AMP phosphodiesterase CpdA
MRWGAYLASQYLWLLLVLVCCAIPWVFPYSNLSEPIRSDVSSSPFDPSLSPGLFVHFTDIHLNHITPERTAFFTSALDLVQQMHNPLTLFTGDLADNFDRRSMPQHGVQQREDFEIYLRLLRAREGLRFIDVAGNHDFFSVFSFDSTESFYARHKNWTHDRMLVSVEKAVIGGQPFSFILANAFDFPAPHPPLQAWGKASRQFLDLLEDAIDGLAPGSIAIFCAHYPFNFWKLHKESKKGRTLEQILTDGRIQLYLTGHTHPARPFRQHHKGLMEIIGADFLSHHKIGVVTVDNGRIAYHDVDLTHPQLTFVTNPIQITELFNGQVFNELDTPLRVISFQERQPNITVTGDIHGHLKCEKMPGFWLCSMPLEISSGDYSIKFEGDLIQQFDFLISNVSRSYFESVYFFSYTTQLYVSLGALFFLQLLIIAPFPIAASVQNLYFTWLTENGVSERSFWLFSLGFGFLGVRMRIAQLPRMMRFSLLLCVVAVLCCPLIITRTEGHLGAIWIFGHICDGGSSFYVFSGVLVLFYQLVIIMPLIILYSALGAPWHKMLFVDLGFAIVSIGGVLGLDIKYVAESAEVSLAIVAPLMSLVPMWLYGLAAWFLRKRWIEERMKRVTAQPLFEIDNSAGLLTTEDDGIESGEASRAICNSSG